ncbi:MAG: ASCH domain-containing protein [Steroidobacteraceae bacterium]
MMNRRGAPAGKCRLHLLLLAAGGALSLVLGAPAGAGAPEAAVAATAKIEAFVAAARTARPDEPIDAYTVRTLGSSEEMFERLLPLILDGSKTGTFSLGEPVQTGALVLVTHFDGTPALIWRVTAVEIVPFDAIDERHLEAEGPALRNIEAWRQVHIRAWAAQLAGKSRAEIGRTPVVVQRFRVIHPQAPSGPHR